MPASLQDTVRRTEVVKRLREIHETLRQGTAELHHAVETRMNIAGRLGSADRYRDLLQGFLGMFEPLEAQLAEFSWPETLDMEARRKSPLIRADLAFLGAAREADRVPPAAHVVDLPCEAAAFGCLYVLEGSTLGGRVILKQVRVSLGFDAGGGARFFAGYREQTGAMWTRFLGVLGTRVNSREEVESALSAARATFVAMDLRMNAGPVPRTG